MPWLPGVPEAAFGVNGAGRGLERMTRYPNGNKPAPDYRSGCSSS